MKQRLGLAAALLQPRDLLVLDEPTNGLDPQGMREIGRSIKSLAADGTTVFLSSHLLDEIEQVCTRRGDDEPGPAGGARARSANCAAGLHARLAVTTPDAADAATGNRARGRWWRGWSAQVHVEGGPRLLRCGRARAGRGVRGASRPRGSGVRVRGREAVAGGRIRGADRGGLRCRSGEAVWETAARRKAPPCRNSTAEVPAGRAVSRGARTARPRIRLRGSFALNELATMFRRIRNLVLLGALAAIPLALGIAIKVTHESSGRCAAASSRRCRTTGCSWCSASLSLTLPIFLPMALGVVAGDSISGEAAQGTLRYLLVAPVGRIGCSPSRAVALVVFCLVASSRWSRLGLRDRTEPVPDRAGDAAVRRLDLHGCGAGEGGDGSRCWWRPRCSAWRLVGLFVSTLTDTPIAAMAVAIGRDDPVRHPAGDPAAHAIQPWLYTDQWASFADLLRDPVYLPNIEHNLLIQAGYVGGVHARGVGAADDAGRAAELGATEVGVPLRARHGSRYRLGVAAQAGQALEPGDALGHRRVGGEQPAAPRPSPAERVGDHQVARSLPVRLGAAAAVARMPALQLAQGGGEGQRVAGRAGRRRRRPGTRGSG